MSRKPNIILVLADDLGIGDVHCFNPDSRIPTPNLDALADQGMRMTDAHASSAVCSPSRYALLTGRYNWRSRLKLGVLPGLSTPLIEPDRLTLPALLKRAGYRTACVGKWHLGMNWTCAPGGRLPDTYEQQKADPTLGSAVDYGAPIQDGPLSRGFDYFYGMPASLDQPPFVRIENDRVILPPDHMVGEKDFMHSEPGKYTSIEYGPAEPGFDPARVVPEMDEKVLSLVEEYARGDQPFFLYYPTPAVHGPLVPAPEFAGKSAIGPYGDFVMQLDQFMGRLGDKLEETGVSDQTLVLFTSDNGCSTIVDFLKLRELGHSPSAVYRGTKGDIWDGGHRIPFLVRWPGEIAPGSTCDQTVCLVDLFAAFGEIAGVSYGDDAGEDSVSCLPLWKGSHLPLREATIHHSLLGSFAIRQGKWKLEFCPGSGSQNYPMNGVDTQGMPPLQLYDMDADVAETCNVVDQYPEVVAELTDLASHYVLDGRSTPGGPQRNCAAEFWPGLEWLETQASKD